MPDFPTDGDYTSKARAYETLRQANYPYLSDYNVENPPKPREQPFPEEDHYNSERGRYLNYIKCTILFLVAAFVGYLVTLSDNDLSYVRSVSALYHLANSIGTIMLPIFIYKWAVVPKPPPRPVPQPVSLQTETDQHTFVCCGKRVGVHFNYHFSPASKDTAQLFKALHTNTFLVLKNFFESLESRTKLGDDPDDPFGQSLPGFTPNHLQNYLEGVSLPTVCDICHDYQPQVFRYKIYVTFQGTDDPLFLPIGEPY